MPPVRKSAHRRYQRKLTLYFAQGGRCIWCHQRMYLAPAGVDSTRPDLATFEHIIPRSCGGGNGSNVALACKCCNNNRQSWPVGEMDITAFS